MSIASLYYIVSKRLFFFFFFSKRLLHSMLMGDPELPEELIFPCSLLSDSIRLGKMCSWLYC